MTGFRILRYRPETAFRQTPQRAKAFQPPTGLIMDFERDWHRDDERQSKRAKLTTEEKTPAIPLRNSIGLVFDTALTEHVRPYEYKPFSYQDQISVFYRDAFDTLMKIGKPTNYFAHVFGFFAWPHSITLGNKNDDVVFQFNDPESDVFHFEKLPEELNTRIASFNMPTIQKLGTLSLWQFLFYVVFSSEVSAGRHQ